MNKLGNKLQNIPDNFPNLRNLTMKISYFGVAKSETAVHFPGLENLILIAVIDRYDDISKNDLINNMVKLLQSNRQLKVLEIHTNVDMALSKVLNIIDGCTSISTLKMFGKIMDVTEAELNQFAREYPLMKELILGKYRFTSDNAIKFIQQMNSLTNITFFAKERSDCERIINQLGSKWKIVNYNNFESEYVIFMYK